MEINCFLDTNVLIGYIFTLDTSYDMSSDLIDQNHKIYISSHVKEETKIIFRNKNREYSEFLLKLIKRVAKRNYFLISNETIHKTINGFEDIGKLKNKDMHNAFDKIWDKYDLSENFECEKVLGILNKFYRNLDSSQHMRKNQICNKIIEIYNHKIKDQSVLEKIEKENLREILHEKDEDILFDIDQYAKKHPELDLCLVSWDDKFIEAVRILINQLSFKRYIGRYESNTEISKEN